MELEDLKTMRDINDYCVQRGIPSLAQGMIELPPPLALRKITAETAMQENIHTVCVSLLLCLYSWFIVSS